MATLAQNSATELNPEVQVLVDDFLRAKQRCARLCEGLTSTQLCRRVAENRWSIAECIAHLNLAGAVYLGALRTALNEAIRDKVFGAPPFNYGALMRWYIRQTEPPPRLKIKAPKSIRPLSFSDERVAAEFEILQEWFIKEAVRADGIDLARARVRFPFLQIWRMPLGGLFHLAAAHQRRHLWQAEQLRATILGSAHSGRAG